ncbi:hypothetical protein QAD02_013975, partial [Eretmocerus hayati]
IIEERRQLALRDDRAEEAREERRQERLRLREREDGDSAIDVESNTGAESQANGDDIDEANAIENNDEGNAIVDSDSEEDSSNEGCSPEEEEISEEDDEDGVRDDGVQGPQELDMQVQVEIHDVTQADDYFDDVYDDATIEASNCNNPKSAKLLNGALRSPGNAESIEAVIDQTTTSRSSIECT